MNKYEEGQVLLINKPLYWTSFDVVRKIRGMVKTKKVGHAGTLDPLATGLLIICTGKFTKKINEFMAKEKVYTGTITIGAVTPTYDLESDPAYPRPTNHLSEEDIRQAAKKLTGDILQKPPAHSAIKQEGKRVYELARRGKEVKMEARPVSIKQFDIIKYEEPVIHFYVRCSTGTYIRSLANDIGEILGCGGYLSSLCRTMIGEYSLENAVTPAQFEEMIRE